MENREDIREEEDEEDEVEEVEEEKASLQENFPFEFSIRLMRLKMMLNNQALPPLMEPGVRRNSMEQLPQQDQEQEKEASSKR